MSILYSLSPRCVPVVRRELELLFRSTCSANRWAHREKGKKAKGDNSWKGSIQEQHRSCAPCNPARIPDRKGGRHFVSSKSHNLRRRTTPFLLHGALVESPVLAPPANCRKMNQIMEGGHNLQFDLSLRVSHCWPAGQMKSPAPREPLKLRSSFWQRPKRPFHPPFPSPSHTHTPAFPVCLRTSPVFMP